MRVGEERCIGQSFLRWVEGGKSVQVRVWDLGLFPVSRECRGFMRSAHQRASSSAMVEGLECGVLWTDGRTVGRVASSYILCIENCRGEYLLFHACLYDSYWYFLPGPFLLLLFFRA